MPRTELFLGCDPVLGLLYLLLYYLLLLLLLYGCQPLLPQGFLELPVRLLVHPPGRGRGSLLATTTTTHPGRQLAGPPNVAPTIFGW